HVIVLIGENRTFDHAFGTYVPRPGQLISNLVSKGIVNADGTPGPNFALAAQAEATPQAAFYISSDAKTRYAVLPGPSTSGSPTATRAAARAIWARASRPRSRPPTTASAARWRSST